MKVTRDDGSVRISFAGMHAHGVTYDIALVRLASAMMDDARYRGAVMETLRGPMQIDS